MHPTHVGSVRQYLFQQPRQGGEGRVVQSHGQRVRPRRLQVQVTRLLKEVGDQAGEGQAAALIVEGPSLAGAPQQPLERRGQGGARCLHEC